ncbi:hypothetical protein N0V87_003813 [Didymella glomerata]|uniref:Uncharacterized protein n=1 Tax=Didymella glomerata TaxID=749621 RepID=A0A9W9C0I4_9PLEO|nr:hypothetical protein N0V87_003813 [Didymella glomerata]
MTPISSSKLEKAAVSEDKPERSLSVSSQPLSQVCRQMYHEIPSLSNSSTLTLDGFCYFNQLAAEFDDLEYDFTKVRVLKINTMKMREYIRYWVSSDQRHQLFAGQDTFPSIERVVVPSRDFRPENIRTLRLFFDKPDLEVISIDETGSHMRT